jgi:hypothetical protein
VLKLAAVPAYRKHAADSLRELWLPKQVVVAPEIAMSNGSALDGHLVLRFCRSL